MKKQKEICLAQHQDFDIVSKLEEQITTQVNDISIANDDQYFSDKLIGGQKVLEKALQKISQFLLEAYKERQINLQTQQTNKQMFFKIYKGRRVLVFSQKQETEEANFSFNFQVKLEESFKNIKEKVCTNQYVYFCNFYDDVTDSIWKNDIIKNVHAKQFYTQFFPFICQVQEKFKNKKMSDFYMIARNWTEFKSKTTNFPSYPLQQRQFQKIDQFQSILENTSYDKQEFYKIENILKSDNKPEMCKDDCVCIQSDLSQMCQGSIEKQTWISECKNISNKIECNQHDCKNQQIQKQIKSEEKVDTKMVWGIDYYTRKNLLFLMPQIYTTAQKEQLLSEIMMFINKVDKENWNLSNVLLKMINQYEEKIKSLEKQNFMLEFMKMEQDKDIEELNQKIKFKIGLEILYKCSQVKQMRQTMRIHSKGLGVICKNKNGIKKNTLIDQYLGEVYPPWYWFIKQDALKQFLNDIKNDKYPEFKQYQSNCLADFFNITVEKNKSEKNGREVIVFDPILYGNYTSRLSHSCDPNCWVIPVIVNGQYSISMYALRDINFQEELTFDYCSYTECKQEMKNSICLCGENKCKIYYLQFASKHSDFFNENIKFLFIDDKDTYLLKNCALLMDCNMTFNQKRKTILENESFGDNLFKNSPKWVKVWASFCILKIIDEAWNLQEHFKEKKLTQSEHSQIESEIQDLKFQRINNLIISIDKIRNYCNNQQQENTEYPIDYLNADDQINFLTTFIQMLRNCKQLKLSEITRNKLDHICDDSIKTIKHSFSKYGQLEESQKNILKIKYTLLCISCELKGTKKENLKLLAFILHLMSFTVAYFVLAKFKSYEVKVDIRKCDLFNPDQYLVKSDIPQEEQIQEMKSVIKTIPQVFNSDYLLFQHLFWHDQSIPYDKETINKSIRGTLCYPNFNTLVKMITKDPKFSVKDLVTQIQKKPGKSWKLKQSRHYEEYYNNQRIYGSVQMDNYFMEKNNLDQVMNMFQKSKQEKMIFFDKFWKTKIEFLKCDQLIQIQKINY